MKQKNSAIMQMMMGTRGNMEMITYSEEYGKLLDIAVEKHKRFQEKIKDNPELVKAFDEYVEAYENETAICADESYREGFAFGLAIGQEVFDEYVDRDFSTTVEMTLRYFNFITCNASYFILLCNISLRQSRNFIALARRRFTPTYTTAYTDLRY